MSCQGSVASTDKLHKVCVERRGKNDGLFWNVLVAVAGSFLLISSLGLFLACSSLCVPMTVSHPFSFHKASLSQWFSFSVLSVKRPNALIFEAGQC